MKRIVWVDRKGKKHRAQVEALGQDGFRVTNEDPSEGAKVPTIAGVKVFVHDKRFTDRKFKRG